MIIAPASRNKSNTQYKIVTFDYFREEGKRYTLSRRHQSKKIMALQKN